MTAGTRRRAAAPPGRPRRPSRPRATRGTARETLLLMLPALVPVLVFSVGPLLYGIYLAFTDARSGRNAETSFVGLANFGDLLADGDFWSSFRIGMVWAISVTVLQFAASLGLALLLNENLRLRGFARVLALVPWAMPPVVIGLMWRLVYHPDAGVLNDMLLGLGLIGDGVDWLNDFSVALPAVIVVGVWTGMPQTTVVLLAGLQSVPRELYEAGHVDGAGTWRRFWNITLPQLRPVVVTITSLDFVWNINQFGLVYVLTQGGPGGRTRLPMLFAYEEAFRYGFFGYAATLGVAIVIVVLAVLGVYLWRQMREAD
ncbi:transporter integral membrane protein [Sphaerisporangium rufum]|uniref:Transporter integral membrane protein n=1 Tax=Sphaerisporangium rufum TaxID=1381558 RepID=A0A919RBU7_9ACTN|nr:sugar ABC transporter permease [Sphaerisporangium rufum]GII81095.1 transporter integral membrane protein [Sphaerisporangium rufum]